MIRRPTGTRDLFPADLARQRYITQAWRDVALRHGFDEIAGPSFEHLALYTLKSGEGIVSELFSFTRAGGDTDYALRPEFTPTLARMYAARGNEMPKPTRWFTTGPYFRAERPQRGRLREFHQWNCDILSDDGTPEGRARADAEIIAVCCALCCELGLTLGLFDDAIVQYSDRDFLAALLGGLGIGAGELDAAFVVLDRALKVDEATFVSNLGARGASAEAARRLLGVIRKPFAKESLGERLGIDFDALDLPDHKLMNTMLAAMGRAGGSIFNPGIVRGLAYYTGMVFEVLADGERAIAGGGRYDNLIELMGGQPTPAVGFAMGDVVLSLLLQDKGLMPEGPALLDAISRPPASARPDVFVISADEEQGDHLVTPLLARLRTGVASKAWQDNADHKPWDANRFDPASGGIAPLHARTSDKSTRNLRKLLADAERQHARFAAIIHRDEVVQLKDMDNRDEHPEDLHVDPASDKYVGKVIAQRLAAARCQ